MYVNYALSLVDMTWIGRQHRKRPLQLQHDTLQFRLTCPISMPSLSITLVFLRMGPKTYTLFLPNIFRNDQKKVLLGIY